MFLDTAPIVVGLAHSLWLGALLYASIITTLRWLPDSRTELRTSLVCAGIYLLPILVGLVVLLQPVQPTVVDGNLFEPTRFSLTDALFIVWISGSGGMFAKLLKDLREIQLLVSRSMPVDDTAFRDRFARLAESCGLKADVQCLFTRGVSAPCLVGVLRRAVLIPVSCFSMLSADELDAIILHELAHVRRLDVLHSLLQELVKAAFFFNPFVHLLVQVSRIEREYACDAIASALSSSPRTLAQALLRLGLNAHTQPLVFAVTAGHRP